MPLVNINAEMITKELTSLGIRYDSEWVPADNLWALFFSTFDGRTEGCAFRINGYFAPLLLVHSGTLEIEEGYISAADVISLVKNAYCKHGVK